MARLEPLLLIAPDHSQAAFLSHNLNDFTQVINAGVPYRSINREPLLKLPIKTPIDLTLYSAHAKEDQLRYLWPRQTNTQFLAPEEAYTQAAAAKENYRQQALHTFAVESNGADGFFAFLELYATPLIDCARALEEADLFPTLLDGYAREETTDPAHILDSSTQALTNLKGYVKEVNNLNTTNSFLELLYTMQKTPVSVDALCEDLVALAATNRDQAPLNEGRQLLSGVQTYRYQELFK